MGLQLPLLTKQEIISLLSDILNPEELSDASVEINQGSRKGDGYLSSMTKVSIKTNGNEIDLIIKSAPKSEELRKHIPVNTVFLREIYFYDVIIPAFDKFQIERNLIPIKCFAKCYKTVKENFSECIVLENVRMKGFDLWNRKVLMDEIHIQFLLKKYGKFHAISFAMKDQNNELFQNLISNLPEVFQNTDGEFFTAIKNSVDFVINIFEDEGNDQIVNMLKELQEKKIDGFLKSIGVSLKRNEAILHGDCWCNNMMFKYKDNNGPDELCLLDFQLARSNSPVNDISYFLYASSRKEIYNNLDHYLRIYHDSLCDYIRALGSNPEHLYPYEELKKDWKIFSRMGYIMSLIVHKCAVVDEEDVVDMVELAGKNEGIAFFNMENKNDALSRERLRDLTLHVFENGFLE